MNQPPWTETGRGVDLPGHVPQVTNVWILNPADAEGKDGAQTGALVLSGTLFPSQCVFSFITGT